MKDNCLKKLVVIALLTLSVVLARAASITYTLNPAGITNTLGAPLLVNNIVLLSNGTNSTVLAFDAPTNSLTYSNNSYNSIVQYATNWITTWTNFFGVTNSTTNISLVNVTNTVAANTNTYPARFGISATASNTVQLDNVSYYFLNGMLLSNNSSGIATITINYVK